MPNVFRRKEFIVAVKFLLMLHTFYLLLCQPTYFQYIIQCSQLILIARFEFRKECFPQVRVASIVSGEGDLPSTVAWGMTLFLGSSENIINHLSVVIFLSLQWKALMVSVFLAFFSDILKVVPQISVSAFYSGV